MLKSHFDVVEKSLLASSQIVVNAGHPLHKGMPREAFIRDFLELHLPETLGIGTGEIFDSNSLPNQQRNQLDIVLYRKSFPKLHYGATVCAYMAESVVAAIEIKSTLDKVALQQAISAAKVIKSLQRNISVGMNIGYQPPSIMSYVVAYDGPANMATVYGWLAELHAAEQIQMPELPADGNQRAAIKNPSVDLVVVLGKGILYCDTSPVGALPDEARNQHHPRWVWVQQQDGNLFYLFIHLTTVTSGTAIGVLDTHPYLRNIVIQNIGCGT